MAPVTRWLTARGVPTRIGKTRWGGSVVWGMLRNPAYMGKAIFGTTKTVHQQPGLNRRTRLEGRSTPHAVTAVDRPREEHLDHPHDPGILRASDHLATQLPDAIRALDAFHLTRLGLVCVDEVHRRVQQDITGHRRRTGDPLYGIL